MQGRESWPGCLMQVVSHKGNRCPRGPALSAQRNDKLLPFHDMASIGNEWRRSTTYYTPLSSPYNGTQGHLSNSALVRSSETFDTWKNSSAEHTSTPNNNLPTASPSLALSQSICNNVRKVPTSIKLGKRGTDCLLGSMTSMTSEDGVVFRRLITYLGVYLGTCLMNRTLCIYHQQEKRHVNYSPFSGPAVRQAPPVSFMGE